MCIIRNLFKESYERFFKKNLIKQKRYIILTQLFDKPCIFGYQFVGYLFFSLLQFYDLFFNSIFANHFVGKNFVFLPNSVGAIYCLLLYSRVPPGVNQVNIISSSKVETYTTSL